MIDTQEARENHQQSIEHARLELPPAPASERGAVKAWSQPVEMLTYEAAVPEVNPRFLEKRVYQGSSGRVYPLPVIDRVETTPVRRMWQALHIENESIRVMILPELGGRIHVALDKRTGYDFIYRQNVIKPALVGLAGPWVSGGIEFNWPQHHRPATFMPTETAIERADDGSITLWCSDHDPMERMKGMHGVRLTAGKAVMEVRVRLYNRTMDTRTFLWWANVATHVNESYQSFFPQDVRFAADHAKRAMTSYPLSEGTYYGIDYGSRATNGVAPKQKPSHFVPGGNAAPNDLGWYTNIPVPTSYMIANSKGDHSGGYDHLRGAGTVAVANHHIAPGKKQWTWGNHEFGYAWDRSLTDNDGPYVELMVGAYTDNQPDFSFLAPGETKTFSQFWYPIAEIGVPDLANIDAALRVERRDGAIGIHLQSTSDLANATIRIRSAGATAAEWTGNLSADAPLHHLITQTVANDFVLTLESSKKVLLRYAPHEIVSAEAPTVAEAPAMPAEMTSADELYLAGVHLEQYRHPTRSPEIYWREALRRDAGDSRCNAAMGRWHLRRGELADAETFLRAAIKRLQQRNPNPYDSEPLYNLGLTLLYRGNIDSAYDFFYKATWSAAWASPAYQRLAEIDCRRGSWASALDHINRALNKDSDNLNALALKGMILQRSGETAAARYVLEQALALDPLDIFCRFVDRGDAPQDGQQCLDLCFDLVRCGFTREAFELITRVLQEDLSAPDGSQTLLLYLKAQLARELGESSRSAEDDAASADWRYVFPHRIEEMLLLQNTLNATPDDARAHFYLGNLLYDKRRHVEAIAHWERAVSLEPSIATLWRNLAIGYFNAQQNTEAAIEAFRKARAVDPADARLFYEFDQLMKRTGTTPADRLDLLEKHMPLVRQRDDLAVEVASLLNSEGRPDDALNLLLARQFQPWEGGEGAALAQYMRAHMLIAVRFLATQETKSALDHLHAALTPPTSLAEAIHVLMNVSAIHFWLGIAYAKASDTAESQYHLEIAARERADFQQMQVLDISEATYWSGRALRKLGREEEARALFQQVIGHAKHLRENEPTIDFFATSLPTVLLFDEELRDRTNIQADFLHAQAQAGMGMAEYYSLLQHVLKQDCNHTGAIDLIHLGTTR